MKSRNLCFLVKQIFYSSPPHACEKCGQTPLLLLNRPALEYFSMLLDCVVGILLNPRVAARNVTVEDLLELANYRGDENNVISFVTGTFTDLLAS